MIKFLVMDVDGTLTDGKIYMGNSGEMMKAFNIKDGCGIHDLLPQNNILPVIITGRKSAILENRCRELGITELYQGVDEKLEKLNHILKKYNSKYESVAYIGDDINDFTCMREVMIHGGLVGCPKDAVNEVKNLASFISEKDGGNGAVREFIEWIIRQ